MDTAVETEVKVRKPKHIIYLEDRVREAKAYEDYIRSITKAEDYPYYALWCAIEETQLWEDQLAFELKHWDGDPEAERHIPFSKDTL